MMNERSLIDTELRKQRENFQEELRKQREDFQEELEEVRAQRRPPPPQRLRLKPPPRNLFEIHCAGQISKHPSGYSTIEREIRRARVLHDDLISRGHIYDGYSLFAMEFYDRAHPMDFDDRDFKWVGKDINQRFRKAIIMTDLRKHNIDFDDYLVDKLEETRIDSIDDAMGESYLITDEYNSILNDWVIENRDRCDY